VTPDQAVNEAKSGKLRPVYLVVGEEQHESDRVVKALKIAVTAGGIDGLNDDTVDATTASADQVLSIARTMPMMATRRWLLARNIHIWDSDKATKKPSSSKNSALSPFDALSEYAETAGPSTVLVLVASKMDKRRKLYTTAKKMGWLVQCEALKRAELPGWIVERASLTKNPISRSVADLIAELAGPELSSVSDAVERVCLYVGSGKQVTEEAVTECVTKLRTASVWELVSSVGSRNIGRSLELLDDVYDPQDRGLRLIGVLAWAARQLIRFEQATRSGMPPPDAAKAAGAPPFKARELAEQVKGFPQGALAHFVIRLKEADLALKGASRRPPRAIVEQMVLDLCRGV
jgi:DNA polymerase-3 subunit delta